MSNPIFSASFIRAKKEWIPAAPYFKKVFSLRGKIKRATLYISSLGVFEARINGVRVGDDYMTPGWTNYNKRLQFFDYDVTNMLSAESEIIVGVGNGWYSSLIAAIEIVYKDGKKDVIVTDESWQVARSETLFSGIYDGEITDARISPEFTEQASIFDYDKSVLIPVEGEKTRLIGIVEPRRIIKTPKGETLIDFGQELTGAVRFTLNAKGGECVQIQHAEVLDKDGNFYKDNYRTARSEIVYTAKEGSQTYMAKYTFFGFRYIKLIDWPG